jgi:hypothetical protein
VEARLRAVATVDGDLRQAREHVVARVLALLDRELVEVDPVLEDRLRILGARRRLTRFSVEADVDPVTDLLAVYLGHTEHARDHLDREGSGEVGDGVELAPVVQRVEKAADHITDHGFERGHRTGCEHTADERAEAIVLRRIHHDDVPVAADLLRILREQEELDAVRAGECLPVAVSSQDVGEARQGVEPVTLAVVDGRFVAETPVHLGRVVEELFGERIELDGGFGDAHACSLPPGRGATVTDGIDKLAPPRSTASTTVTSSSTSIRHPLK